MLDSPSRGILCSPPLFVCGLPPLSAWFLFGTVVPTRLSVLFLPFLLSFSLTFFFPLPEPADSFPIFTGEAFVPPVIAVAASKAASLSHFTSSGEGTVVLVGFPTLWVCVPVGLFQPFFGSLSLTFLCDFG